jgi:hypothetical protein
MTMTNAFSIEVDGETVGVVVAEARGFQFLASDRATWPLEGTRYRHVRQAQRAAEDIYRRRAAGVSV